MCTRDFVVSRAFQTRSLAVLIDEIILGSSTRPEPESKVIREDEFLSEELPLRQRKTAPGSEDQPQQTAEARRRLSHTATKRAGS